MTSESRPETEQGNSAGGGPATATSVNESKPPAGGETFPAANAKDAFIGRVLEHYRLEERLGAGGMGLLYRATDLTLKRAVAVKLLARQLVSDETAKARFVQEARAASALDHPNIATVYDIGEEDGELFIVMALYDGETLKQRLEKGRLPVDEAVAILRQVVLGLDSAHRAGIVHRDIKPANILKTSGGTVKILDFGVAKLLGESQAQMTQAGEAMGTVLYMSPEQLGGKPVDARSDLWSVGVLAYELLTGASPFQTDSSAATAARILHDEPSSLTAVPGVPDWLALLVSQLLRKNPPERPQSAREVLRRLEHPDSASRTEPPQGPAHASRRRVRWWTALGLAAGLLLATVVGWALRTRISKQPADPDRSIAVLPFASLSTGEENAYLAEGFHDELLRQIGKIGDLRVISRTSVLQYKAGARNLREIAEALGVSSIVEGSVQRAGNRVRVAATLIDARSDRQLWGDRYDGDATDVFGIQASVAEEIARALRARLSPAQKEQLARKPTQSAQAYDLYLRALEYANRPGYYPDNFAFAERLCRQAIQTDPSFALARARLAGVMMHRYYFVAGTPDSVAQEARAEAEESLRLQPDLPDGHLALGLYYYWAGRDFDRALKEFEMARAGLPGESLYLIGAIARRQGKFDAAIRNEQKAVELDPRSPITLLALVISLTQTRRYQEADQVLDRALTIAPDFVYARSYKALLHEIWKGETELAQEVLRAARGRLSSQGEWSPALVKLMMLHPRETLPVLDSLESESIVDYRGLYPKAFLYAVAHQALGEAARARQEYEAAVPLLEAEVKKSPSRIYQRTVLARAYAGLGRKEDALREARRAVELLPISKDAFFGPDVEISRAAVETRVGEKDAAIERIRYLLSIPCELSPAILRIDLTWAPLRDDPRFRKLAELDPK
jgi:serine/threonine-protein kinase